MLAVLDESVSFDEIQYHSQGVASIAPPEF
jgi:hypothetical protein